MDEFTGSGNWRHVTQDTCASYHHKASHHLSCQAISSFFLPTTSRIYLLLFLDDFMHGGGCRRDGYGCCLSFRCRCGFGYFLCFCWFCCWFRCFLVAAAGFGFRLAGDECHDLLISGETFHHDEREREREGEECWNHAGRRNVRQQQTPWPRPRPAHIHMRIAGMSWMCDGHAP